MYLNIIFIYLIIINLIHELLYIQLYSKKKKKKKKNLVIYILNKILTILR